MAVPSMPISPAVSPCLPGTTLKARALTFFAKICALHAKSPHCHCVACSGLQQTEEKAKCAARWQPASQKEKADACLWEKLWQNRKDGQVKLTAQSPYGPNKGGPAPV